MTDKILLLTGAALTAIWGIAHLFPTKGVVKDFGDISKDNKNIITMEWIIEGAALIFIGVLTGILALVDYTNEISWIVFLSVVIMLVVLSVISLFTGFKVNFLPFKLCPFIFSASAVLIFIGGVL
ncbi:MAG: hypothetical protein JSV22_04835 [Bacteroidales bacterium]|nr:MAG: hypothetical protein JSV22_04835 [Bacteroidales bacterium]